MACSADPQLTLYRGTAALWENDDWSSESQDVKASSATRAGAFAFPAGSKDAAMLVTLAPGTYSAVVTGANNSSGTALVEVYEVP